MTPAGKPGNVGTVVATLAPWPGGAQQWMCAIVLGLTSPLKVTSTRSICATGSSSTSAVPVPVESFGGSSAAPLNVPVNVVGFAGGVAVGVPAEGVSVGVPGAGVADGVAGSPPREIRADLTGTEHVRMNVEVRHAAGQTGEQRRFCTFGCTAVGGDECRVPRRRLRRVEHHLVGSTHDTGREAGKRRHRRRHVGALARRCAAVDVRDRARADEPAEADVDAQHMCDRIQLHFGSAGAGRVVRRILGGAAQGAGERRCTRRQTASHEDDNHTSHAKPPFHTQLLQAQV